jgi:hypothetical protein
MKLVPTSLTQGIGRSILQTKANSPHIFFAAGVVGVVATTVLACKATLKVSDTLDTIKKDMEALGEAKTRLDNGDLKDEYTEVDFKKDVVFVYTRSGWELTKLYGPAIIVGTLSIAALTGSHVQLTRRNTALMAAYAIVQKAYEEYRERVREAVGEEKERDLYRGIQIEELEDGQKALVHVGDTNKLSPYSKIFDEYSPSWQKDPELNRLFVQCQQNYANNLLQSRGHLFLNEVYDMLGIDRTRAGQVVGWVIGPDGDNYVDFGIFDCDSSRFVNGWERSLVLDFNVDGVIYDKIRE